MHRNCTGMSAHGRFLPAAAPCKAHDLNPARSMQTHFVRVASTGGAARVRLGRMEQKLRLHWRCTRGTDGCTRDRTGERPPCHGLPGAAGLRASPVPRGTSRATGRNTAALPNKSFDAPERGDRHVRHPARHLPPHVHTTDASRASSSLFGEEGEHFFIVIAETAPQEG